MAKFIPEMFNTAVPLPGGGWGDAWYDDDSEIFKLVEREGEGKPAEESAAAKIAAAVAKKRLQKADGEQTTTEATE